MDETYAPLPAHLMEPGTTFLLPQREFEAVTVDDPAIRVMTDFREVRALTVPPGVSMDSAYQRMLVNGVRMLLVVDEKNVIVGLITSVDVEGEAPLKLMQERALQREELRVADIMTACAQLEVIDMRDVEHARVGHVVASLKAAGRQHAMVVERDAQDSQRLCGLFSATQIARQLGRPIQVSSVARSFAEVEEALVR